MDCGHKLFPVVAVIPSLNPDNKLLEVVDGLFGCGFTDILIVDDGSRQECQEIFDALEEKGCLVQHHKGNKGKGRALKTAFSYYLANFDLDFYVGVVTADADGQHLPKDIFSTAKAIVFAENTLTEEGASVRRQLALGTRNFDEEQVPFKSRNGNKITTKVFQILYGKWINDTQTGLRAIPNSFLPSCVEIKGERFEYEINMLIEAVRDELDIVEVDIKTVYFDNNRETHFHPVKDSVRIYRVMLSTFLKFASSGLISMVVDHSLFAFLAKIVFVSAAAATAIPLSTAIARVISSVVNYFLNRSFVFNSGKTQTFSLIRYYILCLCQMAASAAGVTGIYLLTKMDSSILKLGVDLALFFISYRIQQRWVFKTKQVF